jgi:RNase H-like domain found in reverse transcriptase
MKRFVLETDVSGKDIGAISKQNKRPLTYLNKSLGVKAIYLSTYENKFLALLEVVKKWRRYLNGAKFI